MKKEKQLEALVVIVTGMILLYLVYHSSVFLYIGLGVGIAAIVIQPLAKLLALAWYKLGDLLGYVVSKVVLGVMFYLLLVPIAFLHNRFNKDTLNLKRKKDSLWSERKHQYTPDDLKNIW
ncbi:MAG: hypothetical protein ACERKD_18325 [Prolixibacteraceae bacterium]